MMTNISTFEQTNSIDSNNIIKPVIINHKPRTSIHLPSEIPSPTDGNIDPEYGINEGSIVDKQLHNDTIGYPTVNRNGEKSIIESKRHQSRISELNINVHSDVTQTPKETYL